MVLNTIDDDQDLMNRMMLAYQKNTASIVDIEEFRSDLTRVMYVSRILRRYRNGGTLNVNLLLNHVIILYNCFDSLATEALIRYMNEDVYPELFALMEFLSRLPVEYENEPINRDIQKQLESELER